VTTRQHHLGSSVDLDVTVELRSPISTSTTIGCAAAEANAQKQVFVPEGISTHTLTCHVANPKLWYPAGHGEQKLYDLLVQVSSAGGKPQEVTKKIGFRTVALKAVEDIEGASFTFEVTDAPSSAKAPTGFRAIRFPRASTWPVTAAVCRTPCRAT
jgi:beta-mannosidase